MPEKLIRVRHLCHCLEQNQIIEAKFDCRQF